MQSMLTIVHPNDNHKACDQSLFSFSVSEGSALLSHVRGHFRVSCVANKKERQLLV